jgi:glycosyltransferase involved in cell wall biosynthesis
MNKSQEEKPADQIVDFASAEPADVTVIVPVFNAKGDLECCLTSLARSTYTQFGVLVVDDGSTETIKPQVDRFGYRYLRIDGPGGPARARNWGVQQTKSTFIIFIDADVCVHPDTIERIMQNFAGDKDLDAVIGTYDDSPADPGFLSQYRNMFHHYTHCQSAGQVTTFWSGCGAMRRDVFIKYGGFDEQRYRCPAIEDIELGTWVTADGGRIVLDQKIQCKHLKRWSFSNMVKTDIFQRGIPWIDLMLRSGKAVKTLNVTGSQRLSVGLVFTACVLVVLAIWWPWALIGAAAAVIALTLLNIRLYRFFASRRGFWFVAKSLPLHWLYFGCCGVSVLFGVVRYYTSGDKATGRRSPLRSSSGTYGQKT